MGFLSSIQNVSLYISRDDAAFFKSTGDSEENRHFIWQIGPSYVAKRARGHFKSKQGIHLTPTLERNAPWSTRTVSFRSRRQRERPKSTGDSEESYRVFNATEKCAHCNEELITRIDEVNVHFIALLGLFERAQGRVSGEKKQVH